MLIYFRVRNVNDVPTDKVFVHFKANLLGEDSILDEASLITIEGIDKKDGLIEKEIPIQIIFLVDNSNFISFFF